MNRETIIIPELKNVINIISLNTKKPTKISVNNYLFKEAINRSNISFEIEVGFPSLNDELMNGIANATTTENKVVDGSLEELASNGSHEEKEEEIEKLKNIINLLTTK